jgi:hypothetical protein
LQRHPVCLTRKLLKTFYGFFLVTFKVKTIFFIVVKMKKTFFRYAYNKSLGYLNKSIPGLPAASGGDEYLIIIVENFSNGDILT